MMFSAVAIQMQVAVDVDITDVIDAVGLQIFTFLKKFPIFEKTIFKNF